MTDPADYNVLLAANETERQTIIKARNAAIRKAMKRPGATQRSVAKQFGVSQQRVDQIVNEGLNVAYYRARGKKGSR